MGILVDKFISYRNIIDISSSAIWVFGEESESNGFKQVILGPMGCGNSINTDPSFYNFEVDNNADLKYIDFSKSKSLNCSVKMFNGDKEITVDLDNLKTFFKMHVFLLIFHFFTEGLPKYDNNDDADLPNQCKLDCIIFIVNDDMENLPKINFKVYLKNSIVCLDDLEEAIACKLDLCLVYDRLNIKALKEDLISRKFVANSQYENSSICRELRFNIVK